MEEFLYEGSWEPDSLSEQVNFFFKADCFQEFGYFSIVPEAELDFFIFNSSLLVFYLLNTYYIDNPLSYFHINFNSSLDFSESEMTIETKETDSVYWIYDQFSEINETRCLSSASISFKNESSGLPWDWEASQSLAAKELQVDLNIKSSNCSVGFRGTLKLIDFNVKRPWLLKIEGSRTKRLKRSTIASLSRCCFSSKWL
jgi:hypothetical protein